MARWQIGQERLGIGGLKPRGGTSLNEVAALADWAEIEGLLAGIFAAARGEQGWLPLALFRTRLIAPGTTCRTCAWPRRWTIAADSAGFAAWQPTNRPPSAPPFWGFVRNWRDGEAKWAGYRRRKPIHGCKAHVAADQEAGRIRSVEVTTAKIHEAAELDAILPDAAGDTYGDSAYQGSRSERAIRAKGGTPRIVHTGTWGGVQPLTRLADHNKAVRRVRARIEKVFGTCKRNYGLRRMRWLSPRGPAG